MSNNDANLNFYDINIGEYLTYLETSGKKPFPFILISGRRGLGKSFLSRDIVWNFRHYEEVLCVSGSEVANGDWRGPCDACDKGLRSRGHHTCRFPQGVIYSAFNSKHLEAVVNKHKRKFIKKGAAQCPRLLVVLDDISMDADLLNKCKTLKFIATMGRHFNITLICITQYIRDLVPKLRRQATMFFTMGETDDAVVRALKTDFFSCIGTDKVVQKTLVALTNNYGCVVKVDTSSKNVRKMVFRFKAVEREHYTVGSTKFRNWIFDHTKTEAERLQEEENEAAMATAPKGTRIRVTNKKGKVYIDKRL